MNYWKHECKFASRSKYVRTLSTHTRGSVHYTYKYRKTHRYNELKVGMCPHRDKEIFDTVALLTCALGSHEKKELTTNT